MRQVVSHAWKVLAAAVLGGCASVPESLQPVTGFEADRYLGTWYEIARLDHSFERGLSKATAEYSKRDDGSIQVVNRGYDAQRDKWREARGVARFVGPPDVASLKVTFFWPFSGDYWIIGLDPDYRWALVGGPGHKYLWVLSRDPHMDDTVYARIVDLARSQGYDVTRLLKSP